MVLKKFDCATVREPLEPLDLVTKDEGRLHCPSSRRPFMAVSGRSPVLVMFSERFQSLPGR